MTTTPTLTFPVTKVPRYRRTPAPVIIALCALLLVELAIRAGHNHLPVPQTWSSPEDQIKAARIDALSAANQTGGVAFLSSSLLDVSIDSTLFAYQTHTILPVYNASLSGANLEVMRWWEDHMVIPKLKPKVLVVGVASRDVNGNDPQGAMIASQFFASDPVRQVNGTESLWQRLERYGDRVSYFFRYRKVLRDPETIHRHNDPIAGENLFVTPGGQETALAHQQFISGPDVKAYFQSTLLDNWKLTPSKLTVLAGIIHDAQAAGIKVVVVDGPVTQYYIDLHPNGIADYDSYEAALATTLAPLHVTFIPHVIWDPVDFADPIHLNGTGAARLTSTLATQLKPLLPA